MVVLSQYPSDPRVRREAEALERHGIEVDVICLREAADAAEERRGTVTAYRVAPMQAKERMERYLWITARFMAASLLKLMSLSRRRRYDVVQFHNMPDYLVFLGLFHRLRGVPVVLDLHDLTVELFESRYGASWARRLLPLVRLAERFSCALATRLITTSSGFEQRLVERGIPAGKITLILNTADPAIFHGGGQRSFARIDRDLRLLYHGSVKERFGVHTAIEALSMVAKEVPGATLRIHGRYDPSYRDRLEALIGRLELRDRVHLGEYLSLESVRELMLGADMGLVPYLSDPFMDIALSTKSFEYVAMGLPVVSSRLPSMQSIFDEQSVAYFAPGSAAEMAARIVELCRRPEERQQMVRRASASCRDISWPAMEKRYVDLIEELARRRRKSGS